MKGKNNVYKWMLETSSFYFLLQQLFKLLDVVLSAHSPFRNNNLLRNSYKLSLWIVENWRRVETKNETSNFRYLKSSESVGLSHLWMKSLFLLCSILFAVCLFCLEFHHHVLFLILLFCSSKGQRHFKPTWTLHFLLPWHHQQLLTNGMSQTNFWYMLNSVNG